MELTRRRIPFTPQCPDSRFYKGEPLECFYKPHFVCFDEVVAEIKALHSLGGRDHAQILNYLRATTDKRVGLFINFGSAMRLEWKRFVV